MKRRIVVVTIILLSFTGTGCMTKSHKSSGAQQNSTLHLTLCSPISDSQCTKKPAFTVKAGSSYSFIVDQSGWVISDTDKSSVAKMQSSAQLKQRSRCSHIPGLDCGFMQRDFRAVSTGKTTFTVVGSLHGEALKSVPQSYLVTLNVVQAK